MIPGEVSLLQAWVTEDEEPAVVERLEAGDRALFESVYATMPREEMVALLEEALVELRGGAVTAFIVEQEVRDVAKKVN